MIVFAGTLQGASVPPATHNLWTASKQKILPKDDKHRLWSFLSWLLQEIHEIPGLPVDSEFPGSWRVNHQLRLSDRGTEAKNLHLIGSFVLTLLHIHRVWSFVLSTCIHFYTYTPRWEFVFFVLFDAKIN